MSRQYYRPGQRNRGRIVPTKRFFLFVTFVAVVVVVVVLLATLVPASFNETNIDSLTAEENVETVGASGNSETDGDAAAEETVTDDTLTEEDTAAAETESAGTDIAHGEVTENDVAEAAAEAVAETAEAVIDTSVTYPMLEFGCDDGEDVKNLQTRLIELGYLKEGNDTGHFGDATEQAVIAFQKNNNLVADGMAGNETQQLLYSDAAKAKS